MHKTIKALAFVMAAVILMASWCDPGNTDSAPEVWIIDPATGEVPIGVVTIAATIIDNLGITSTALYIDGAVSGTHSSYNADTFYFQWDASNEAPESEHEIEVRATDTQNHVGSDAISVYMGEAPSGTVHEGAIDADETWSASGNPHFIQSYLNISNGATVMVEEGCRIRFTFGATVNMTNTVIRESLANGIRTIRSGAIGSQFSENIITTCNDYPLNVQAESVPHIDTSNTLTGNAQQGFQVSGGIVTGTVTCYKHIVPYYISEPVYCGDYEAKGVLIIELGTDFKVGINGAFFVGTVYAGGLIADGTSDRITFASAEIAPSPGDWNCIYFYNDSIDDSCVIRNCNLEHGGKFGDGIIRIQDALPTIVDDSIGYSGSYGIYLEGETPDSTELADDNTFYNNAFGPIGGP